MYVLALMETTTADLEMMDVGEAATATTMAEEERRRRTGEEASGGRREGLFDRAKRGLEKIKEKLIGKIMLRNREDDSIRIVQDLTVRKEEEEEFKVDDLVEDGEEVTVEEVSRRNDKREEETKSGNGSGQTTGGYSFLGDLDDEEKDEELEKRDTENKKRKREDVKVVVKVKSLASSVGWKKRSEAVKGEDRWKRTVEKEVDGVKVKSVEKIPLPGNFELGAIYTRRTA